jgi:hypothetical protein
MTCVEVRTREQRTTVPYREAFPTLDLSWIYGISQEAFFPRRHVWRRRSGRRSVADRVEFSRSEKLNGVPGSHNFEGGIGGIQNQHGPLH